jgi:hypothetical protein
MPGVRSNGGQFKIELPIDSRDDEPSIGACSPRQFSWDNHEPPSRWNRGSSRSGAVGAYPDPFDFLDQVCRELVRALPIRRTSVPGRRT